MLRLLAGTASVLSTWQAPAYWGSAFSVHHSLGLSRGGSGYAQGKQALLAPRGWDVGSG